MEIKNINLKNVNVQDSGSPIVGGSLAYYDPQLSYSGSGSTLVDLSGNNLNATLVNSPTYTGGSGAYFTLNGTNQYISGPNIYNGGGNESHTIEVWVRPAAYNVNIYSDSSSPTHESGYHNAGCQLIGPVGPFYQYISCLYTATGVQRAVNGSSTSAYLNNWRQVVRVYDGTTITPYVNGVPGSSATINWDPPWPLNGPNWYVNFGPVETTVFSGTTANWFSGRYGIIRIYNFALTGAQVLTNFNASRTRYGL